MKILKSPKVLIVATSRKTRGGITSVIKAHESGKQWKKFHCHWVQTHKDGSVLTKLSYLARGFIDFIFRVPFYNIIHIHISQPTTIRRKKPFLVFAKKLGKKIIVHFHAFNVEETVNGKYSKKYAAFFNAADKIIVLSNWWRRQLISSLSLNPNSIEVLYNPCPIVIKDNSNQKDSILYAGTVNERKGYKDLINAFAHIAQTFPSWRLSIAGNGDIEQGKELTLRLGIADRVDFLGWINGKTKEAAFREASIFCLPSYAEGFPMAVLDAWAYGLPVITTPVGGIPDVAKDGENMLLFNPGDIDALSSQLEKLITDEELRNKIAAQSHELANGIFNVDTINSQLGEIYENLGRSKGHKRK